jgi:hypothetical protein
MSRISLRTWLSQAGRRSRCGLQRPNTQERCLYPRTGRCSGPWRPRLEILEDRVYPGDAILGLCAVALWGSSDLASDPASQIERREDDREWQQPQ